jgi:hypothetical protein
MEIANVQTIARQLYEAQGAKAIAEAARRPPRMSNGERANRLRRGDGLKRP